jgi:ELWxxDGT repeat protein
MSPARFIARLTSVSLVAVVALSIMVPTVAAGSSAYLVKDLRADGSSQPHNLTAVGSRIFFTANDGVKGRELYVSDGTFAGTKRVKDIWVGKGSSNPAFLTALGDRVFFVARDGVNGPGLYTSDGTAAGTRRLARRMSCSNEADAMLATGGLVYYAAYDSSTGQCSLSVTDGTIAGTRIVAASIPGFFAPAALNGRVFFFNASCCLNIQLFKTDLAATQVKLVKTVAPCNCEVSPMTAAGSLLYYTVANAPWRTDGTKAGTHPLTTLSTGPTEAREFTSFNGKVYFNGLRRDAGDQPIDSGLWTSNGKAAGTALVKEFGVSLEEMTVLGNTLFFRVEEPSDLWKSNGTTVGTVLAVDTKPFPNELTPLAGHLYFASCDTEANHPGCAFGPWLFVTDGTNASTNRILGITNAMNLVATDTTLFMTDGAELYAFQP